MEDHGDFEDQKLLAAAASWAGSGSEAPVQSQQVEEAKTRKHGEEDPEGFKKRATFSLHVTQLSYEASDFDVRDLFITRGCAKAQTRIHCTTTIHTHKNSIAQKIIFMKRLLIYNKRDKNVDVL